MAARASLSNILEALEMQFDESTSHLNRKTGEVVVVSDEALDAAEDGEDDDLSDRADWEREMFETAREICNSDDYIELPNTFDIDEYQTMERFCGALDDPKQCDQLSTAIKGSGAFRRFNNLVQRYGIADDWYKYRDAALREIAIEWCRDNQIEYEE